MKLLLPIVTTLLLLVPSISYSVDTLREVSIEQIWMQDEWVNSTHITTYRIGTMPPYLSHWKIWVDGAYIDYSLMKYIYNAQNKLIEQTVQGWEDNIWRNGRRATYVYSESDKLLVYKLSLWEEEMWAMNKEVVNTYDDSDYLITTETFRWVQGVKQNYFKDTIINNSSGKQIERITKFFNLEWENAYRYIYEYKDEKIDKETHQLWQDDNWVNETINYYTYTGTKNISEILQMKWKNEKWLENSKFIYGYDNEDREISITEYIWIGEWTPKRLEEWIYKENKLTEYYVYVWFFDEWGNYERTLYEYYTGVENLVVGANLSLIISPNPSSDIVTLRFDSSAEGPAIIEVYNYTGELCKSYNAYVSSGTIIPSNLSLSELSSGNYLININIGGMSISRKLIIKR